MATFGKLTAALMSASQENTLALANLNFDFSLIKCEAPIEYQRLGGCLSKMRKDTAEDGPLHITARKLSALFESEIPQVPHLIQAYGKRSSEIAEMPSINPQPSRSDGVFADYVGADGATIWATATSGESAITMHLLACFLARIWKRAEAVSIWSEIVDERKEVLRQKVQGTTFQIADAIASRIDITRDQLATWDASARAWLHTADEAKRLQQTQLKLILDNISLPVSSKPKLYTAIIESWTVAMCALDNLVQGRAQRIQSGEVLLGLSAWHLYPDLSVLGEKQHHINQSDPLISPGGIITIGVENRPNQFHDGIYWSLPLAHMRFYGDAIEATRRTGLRESQITFDQFQAVVLGSVLSSWGWEDQNVKVPLELITLLGQAASQAPPSSAKIKWLELLGETVQTLQNAKETEQQQLLRLVQFGQRRCESFISDRQDRPPPVFGLTKFENVLSAFDHVGAKLQFLRLWAAARFPKVLLSCAVIRDCSDMYQKARYSSLAPHTLRGRKRPRGVDIPSTSTGTYLEWIEDDTYERDDLNYDEEHETLIPPGPHQKPEVFKFVCGMKSLGIYIPVSRNRMKRTADDPFIHRFESNCLSIEDLYSCLQTTSVKVENLVQTSLRETMQNPRHDGYFDSLRAFSSSQEIYSRLSGARVDLHITDRSMCSKWWSAFKKLNSDSISLGITFSCIALFETGHLEIDPDSLKEALAVSCDNSIFVASLLLCDPSEASVSGMVRRITGNIGKPGFAILIPPSNPKIKEVDCRSWNVIGHEPFDGRLLDSFQSSSLHLSLTGYELALDVGQRGTRDQECFFVETAISLLDRGEWVADLDVIKAQLLWRDNVQAPLCLHGGHPLIDVTRHEPLISVDSWVDFLDRPLSHCIVRSRGNTMARLAAASLAAQKGYRFKIISPQDCLSCILSQVKTIIDKEDDSDRGDRGEDSEPEERADFSISERDSSSEEDGDERMDNLSEPLIPLFPELGFTLDEAALNGPRFHRNEYRKAFFIC